MACTFPLLANLPIYGSRYAHPTFELSNAVPLLAKLLLENESLKNPLLTPHPHLIPVNFSNRVVTILFCYFHILLVYHCALYLWNANFTMCTRNWSYPRLTPVVLKQCHVDMLSSKNRSAFNMQQPLFPFFIWLAFLLIQQSAFTHALIQSIFCSQFFFPLLPHTTHSYFISSISKEAISTVLAKLSHLVRGLHLLKSIEKVIEAPSELLFWDQFKL